MVGSGFFLGTSSPARKQSSPRKRSPPSRLDRVNSTLSFVAAEHTATLSPAARASSIRRSTPRRGCTSPLPMRSRYFCDFQSCMCSALTNQVPRDSCACPPLAMASKRSFSKLYGRSRAEGAWVRRLQGVDERRLVRLRLGDVRQDRAGGPALAAEVPPHLGLAASHCSARRRLYSAAAPRGRAAPHLRHCRRLSHSATHVVANECAHQHQERAPVFCRTS